MKHFIITPFYPYAKSPLTDEILFGERCNILDIGLVHLTQFLIPSLENQSCQDFTLLLGINRELKSYRKDIYSGLLKLQHNSKISMKVMDWFQFYDYIDSLDDNYIIATKIDHDDCFGKDTIKIIQNQQDWKLDFKFFACMSGAMLWKDTGDIREYISPTWKDGLSSFSASPTFLTQWNKHRLLPVYGHTKVTSITIPNKVELIHGINHFYDYDTELAWLYIRHGYNRSREIWYEYGDRLNLTNQEITNQFGIILQN